MVLIYQHQRNNKDHQEILAHLNAHIRQLAEDMKGEKRVTLDKEVFIEREDNSTIHSTDLSTNVIEWTLNRYNQMTKT